MGMVSSTGVLNGGFLSQGLVSACVSSCAPMPWRPILPVGPMCVHEFSRPKDCYCVEPLVSIPQVLGSYFLLGILLRCRMGRLFWCMGGLPIGVLIKRWLGF